MLVWFGFVLLKGLFGKAAHQAITLPNFHDHFRRVDCYNAFLSDMDIGLFLQWFRVIGRLGMTSNKRLLRHVICSCIVSDQNLRLDDSL